VLVTHAAAPGGVAVSPSRLGARRAVRLEWQSPPAACADGM